MASFTSEIPFRITDIDLRFQEAEGVLRLDENYIVIEYQLKDALGIFIKSDREELVISLDAVDEIFIKDWWLTLRLKMSIRPPDLVSELPDSYREFLTMKVSWKHREILKKFVRSVRETISDLE